MPTVKNTLIRDGSIFFLDRNIAHFHTLKWRIKIFCWAPPLLPLAANFVTNITGYIWRHGEAIGRYRPVVQGVVKLQLVCFNKLLSLKTRKPPKTRKLLKTRKLQKTRKLFPRRQWYYFLRTGERYFVFFLNVKTLPCTQQGWGDLERLG